MEGKYDVEIKNSCHSRFAVGHRMRRKSCANMLHILPKGKTFTSGTYSEDAPAPGNSIYGRSISIDKLDHRFWYFLNGSMEVLQTGYCEINDTTCVFHTDDGSYYGYAYLYGGADIRVILEDGSKLTMRKTLDATLLPQG